MLLHPNRFKIKFVCSFQLCQFCSSKFRLLTSEPALHFVIYNICSLHLAYSIKIQVPSKYYDDLIQRAFGNALIKRPSRSICYEFHFIFYSHLISSIKANFTAAHWHIHCALWTAAKQSNSFSSLTLQNSRTARTTPGSAAPLTKCNVRNSPRRCFAFGAGDRKQTEEEPGGGVGQSAVRRGSAAPIHLDI